MSTEMTKRPFMDFAAMRERLDRLFEDVTGVRHADGSWSMAMDVHRALALPPEAKAGGENTAGLIIDSKMHAGWVPEPAPLTTTG